MNTSLLAALLLLPADGASLFCPKPVVELGQRRSGPGLEHSFTLTNRGTAPVTIIDARGSCGCLAPKVSKHALAPGDSARLDVAVSTLAQPDGPNTWKVLVKYRAGNAEQTLELQLKATLVREVGLTPAAVQLIGGPGTRHDIVLTDRRQQPLKLNAIRTTSSRLHASAGDWQKSADGWMRLVRIQLAEDCPAGTWDEVVQLFGDEPAYRELQVPVRIVCRGTQRVLASPSLVRLRHAAGKPSASVLVLLRDAKGEPVEVASVECSDAALAARFAEGAYATAAVRLSIANVKVPQSRSAIRIHIRKPIVETLVVPVEIGQ